VTVVDKLVRKVTCSNDATGLSYVPVDPRRMAPCQRTVGVEAGVLVLRDERKERRLSLGAAFTFLQDSPQPEAEPVPITWRDFFAGSPPEVSPREAFGAVLLYPEDETVIDHLATQPFVADYLHDVLDDSAAAPSFPAGQAERTLIEGFDACLYTLLDTDHAREQLALYDHPAFAQKQAQALWNRIAQANRFEAGRTIRLLPSKEARKAAYERTYGLIYRFIAFPQFENPAGLSQIAAEVHHGLSRGGCAFVVGPPSFAGISAPRFQVLERLPVEALPTFQMHRSILPKARLRPGLTLYRLIKR